MKVRQVISEQVPGKNITRYKLMGRWSDQQVKDKIIALAKAGFKGAFESK